MTGTSIHPFSFSDVGSFHLSLHLFFCASIPLSLGPAFQRPDSPHARSTIINSRQCHRLAFPGNRADEDGSSGLLRTYWIIPFNYCSLDGVRPLIRRRRSPRSQQGQWIREMYSGSPVWVTVVSWQLSAEEPPECTTPCSLSASKVICFERLRLWILKNTVIRDLLHLWESITNLIYHWKGTKLTDLPIGAAYALNMTRWWYEKLIYVFEKAEGRKASCVLCRAQSQMSWFFKGRFIKA